MEAWVWLSVPGVEPRTFCTVMHEWTCTHAARVLALRPTELTRQTIYMWGQIYNWNNTTATRCYPCHRSLKSERVETLKLFVSICSITTQRHIVCIVYMSLISHTCWTESRTSTWQLARVVVPGAHAIIGEQFTLSTVTVLHTTVDEWERTVCWRNSRPQTYDIEWVEWQY